mmetsp:Transcript_28163/g.80973  ORF Transcript_28163/g.80973 Transcript_28163/m.80973 type:complete len:202 (+) Transcript_28163:506-1111(+)
MQLLLLVQVQALLELPAPLTELPELQHRGLRQLRDGHPCDRALAENAETQRTSRRRPRVRRGRRRAAGRLDGDARGRRGAYRRRRGLLRGLLRRLLRRRIALRRRGRGHGGSPGGYGGVVRARVAAAASCGAGLCRCRRGFRGAWIRGGGRRRWPNPGPRWRRRPNLRLQGGDAIAEATPLSQRLLLATQLVGLLLLQARR